MDSGYDGNVSKAKRSVGAEGAPLAAADVECLSGDALRQLARTLQGRVRQLEEDCAGLRAEVAEQHQIRDSVTDALLVFDLDGRIVDANVAACSLYGYSRDEFIGLTGARIVHGDYRHLFEQFRSGTIDDAVFHAESRDMRKDGSSFPIEVRGQRFLYHGKPHLLAVIRDLTGQAEDAEALRRSEELSRMVIESIPIGVWVADRDFKIKLWNVGQELMTGVRREEVLGKNIFECFPSLETSGLAELYRRVMAEGEPFMLMGYPFHDPTLRRESYYLNVTANALKDATGNVTGIVIAVEDITERRKSLDALRESEARYRLLAEHATDVIARSSIDGEVLYVSPAVQSLLGYTPDELVGTNGYENIHPDDRQQVVRAGQEALDTGTPIRLEYRLQHKNGAWLWVETTSQFVAHEGDATATAIITVTRDVTERTRAEQALRDSEATLRAIFNSVSHGILLLSRDGEIRTCNAVAQDIARMLTGRAMRIGDPIFDYLEPEQHERLREHLRAALAGQTVVTERSLSGPDGVERCFEMRFEPVLDALGTATGTCFTSLDITERKQVEKDLRRMHKLESIGLLAGGIAHDFNNLFTGILGNISLAKLSTAPDSELHTILSQTEEAGGRARDLTQQLLTFSKGGAPVKQVVSIGQQIQEWVTFALRGSNARSEFVCAPDIWAVEADAGQLSQVINNLVINAQQAMPDGGIVRVSLQNVELDSNASPALQPGPYVQISIADHGTGIPARYLERVFDPCFTTKQSGSGLGLAIAYSIVQKHGGLITVRSQEGTGSQFDILLPANPQHTTAPPPSHDAPQTGCGRILVMDDEEVVQQLARRALTRLGYEVETVVSGEAAIARYQQEFETGRAFDAVILDLTVPAGMGGKEAIAKLREIDPNVRGIVSSGYSHDPVMADHAAYGFVGVVAKPYTVKQLSETLARVLDAKP